MATEIDMELVKDRLVKGAFVGAGSFASTYIENIIQDNLFDNNIAMGMSELAIGAGTSVGVELVFDEPEALPNNMAEYAGYGIQASAWNSLADAIQTGELAGSRTVSVNTDGGQQTSEPVEVTRVEEDAEEGRPFSAEVA
jgi:hypothetical protein